jgi:hypothetical protein
MNTETAGTNRATMYRLASMPRTKLLAYGVSSSPDGRRRDAPTGRSRSAPRARRRTSHGNCTIQSA